MNFSKSKKRNIIYLLLVVVLAISGAAGLFDLSENTVSSSNGSDQLTVHFLDVGQGDSILIQFPNDSVMLVDAGPDENGAPVISYLKKQGVEKIDYLVATHPHADHIGGMAAVIKEFDINKVYMPKVTHTTKTFEDMLLSIKRKGLKIIPARAGLDILDRDGLQATFIAPCGTDYDSLNNYSAIVKIQYGSTSFLLTGDAEGISEKEMLDNSVDLRADVLKVGHHGSSSSTTPAFLKSVTPEYAVILVGAENKYGHPHQETLEHLADAGVIVYRTDQEGTIIFASDGKQVNKV
ncbi:MAG: ComEC/Rec2 family competence protein [Desulfitobacteriaceae bacterium]|jgi:beta-lactamase superfamily II metal-dependent hydrolase|nr:ComEC/Rec2 family competence protein [Desulfitobacteriaceae bacterium]